MIHKIQRNYSMIICYIINRYFRQISRQLNKFYNFLRNLAKKSTNSIQITKTNALLKAINHSQSSSNAWLSSTWAVPKPKSRSQQLTRTSSLIAIQMTKYKKSSQYSGMISNHQRTYGSKSNPTNTHNKTMGITNNLPFLPHQTSSKIFIQMRLNNSNNTK